MITGLVTKQFTEKGATITIRISNADIDAATKKEIRDIDGEIGYLSAVAPVDPMSAPASTEPTSGDGLIALLDKMIEDAERARTLAVEAHGPEPRAITEEVRQPDLSGLGGEGAPDCSTCELNPATCGYSAGRCPNRASEMEAEEAEREDDNARWEAEHDRG